MITISNVRLPQLFAGLSFPVMIALVLHFHAEDFGYSFASSYFVIVTYLLFINRINLWKCAIIAVIVVHIYAISKLGKDSGDQAMIVLSGPLLYTLPYWPIYFFSKAYFHHINPLVGKWEYTNPDEHSPFNVKAFEFTDNMLVLAKNVPVGNWKRICLNKYCIDLIDSGVYEMLFERNSKTTARVEFSNSYCHVSNFTENSGICKVITK